MIGIREQITWIVYFLLFGWFLAAMYDVMDHFLSKCRINQVLSYILQLFCWLALAYLSASYMMKITEGALTIYAFGFFAIGALVHFLRFSKGFREDLDRFDRGFLKIYKRVEKIIILLVIPKEVLLFGKKLLPKRKTFEKIKLWFRKKFRKGNANEENTDSLGDNLEHPIPERLRR
jgi:hypothetical protein